MTPPEVFWHLLGFLAPAVGVGLLAPGIAKLIWRRELRAVRFARLAAFTMAGAALALVAALAVFGRDGTMAAYAMMVTASAAALWWVGRRRG